MMFAIEKFDVRDAHEIEELALKISNMCEPNPDFDEMHIEEIQQLAGRIVHRANDIYGRHEVDRKANEPTLDEITDAYMKRSNAELASHYLGDGEKADVTVDEDVSTHKFSDHFPGCGNPLPDPDKWEPVETLRDRIAMNAPPMPDDIEVQGENYVDAAWRRARWNYAYADAMLKQRAAP